MATHGNRHLGSVVVQDYGNWHRGYMKPFWSKNSYTKLNYKRQPFNNTTDLKKWENESISKIIIKVTTAAYINIVLKLSNQYEKVLARSLLEICLICSLTAEKL